MLSTLGLRIRTGLTRLVVKTKRLQHEAIRAASAPTGVAPIQGGKDEGTVPLGRNVHLYR